MRKGRVNMDSEAKAVLIASAVAALLAACGAENATSKPPSAADMAGKVKCTGINECRTKGVCAQADHACGGKNACKGQGVTLVPADVCVAKGGTSI
jgi:hypothetical protein